MDKFPMLFEHFGKIFELWKDKNLLFVDQVKNSLRFNNVILEIF